MQGGSGPDASSLAPAKIIRRRFGSSNWRSRHRGNRAWLGQLRPAISPRRLDPTGRNADFGQPWHAVVARLVASPFIRHHAARHHRCATHAGRANSRALGRQTQRLAPRARPSRASRRPSDSGCHELARPTSWRRWIGRPRSVRDLASWTGHLGRASRTATPASGVVSAWSATLRTSCLIGLTHRSCRHARAAVHFARGLRPRPHVRAA